MDITNPIKLIQDKIEQWLEIIIRMLPNIVVAVLVLVIFYFLAKFVKRIAIKFSRKLIKTQSANQLIGNFSFTIVILAGFFITLELLHLSKAVTTLLAGAGIIGLALSFAFQDIASNFVSGILLITRKPFRADDIIETNGYFGKVSNINLRNTILATFQGQIIRIPNRKVFENPIINFTESGARRIDLSVGVSYGDDLEKVSKITIETIKQIPEVIHDKGINVTFEEFGNSSINFKVRFWVKYDKDGSDYLPALNDAIVRLKLSYDKNDIMIPFPIRTLDFGIKGGTNLSEMINLKSDDKKEN